MIDQAAIDEIDETKTYTVDIQLGGRLSRFLGVPGARLKAAITLPVEERCDYLTQHSLNQLVRTIGEA